ncbi:Surfeit locus protein 2 [Mactra antiquata]
MASELEKLLRIHPSLSHDSANNKVKCSLSGHEMPCRVEAIKSYVNGKKYLKLKARDDKNFEQYKPHLIPSTKKYHENQLFCVLTMTHVNKTPDHVKRHVNGRKYKRRLKIWEECQRTGKEYRPPKGRRKVTENQDLRKQVVTTGDGATADNDDDDDENSDVDSLSDLYPADVKDKSNLEETETNIDEEEDDSDSDSDFEFEQLEQLDEEEDEVKENKGKRTVNDDEQSTSGQKREGEKQNTKKKKKQKR